MATEETFDDEDWELERALKDDQGIDLSTKVRAGSRYIEDPETVADPAERRTVGDIEVTCFR